MPRKGGKMHGKTTCASPQWSAQAMPSLSMMHIKSIEEYGYWILDLKVPDF